MGGGRSSLCGVALALCTSTWQHPAWAAPPAPTPPPPAPAVTPPAPVSDRLKFVKKPGRQQAAATVSASGALAGTLLVELVGEVNLPGPHSVAAIMGVGAPAPQSQPRWTQILVDAGAQYRYALKGDFDTALWLGVDATARVRPLLLGAPTDIVLGPMVGFKHTTPFHLALDLGVGPAVGITTYGPAFPTAIARVQVGYSFGKGPRGR